MLDSFADIVLKWKRGKRHTIREYEHRPKILGWKWREGFIVYRENVHTLYKIAGFYRVCTTVKLTCFQCSPSFCTVHGHIYVNQGKLIWPLQVPTTGMASVCVCMCVCLYIEWKWKYSSYESCWKVWANTIDARKRERRREGNEEREKGDNELTLTSETKRLRRWTSKERGKQFASFIVSRLILLCTFRSNVYI